MRAHRVDLVDEDDARRALLRRREELAHALRADADEDLLELGAAHVEERHPRLARHRAREERLAGARRPGEQAALRQLPAEPGELLGRAQVLDDVEQLLLRLVDATNVGEPLCLAAHRLHVHPAEAEPLGQRLLVEQVEGAADEHAGEEERAQEGGELLARRDDGGHVERLVARPRLAEGRRRRRRPAAAAQAAAAAPEGGVRGGGPAVGAGAGAARGARGEDVLGREIVGGLRARRRGVAAADAPRERGERDAAELVRQRERAHVLLDDRLVRRVRARLEAADGDLRVVVVVARLHQRELLRRLRRVAVRVLLEVAQPPQVEQRRDRPRGGCGGGGQPDDAPREGGRAYQSGATG